jgi:hypothetical protein
MVDCSVVPMDLSTAAMKALLMAVPKVDVMVKKLAVLLVD